MNCWRFGLVKVICVGDDLVEFKLEVNTLLF